MLKAKFHKQVFHFKQPGGTSRGVLTKKIAWYFSIWDEKEPKKIGVGECSVIPKLSPDFQNEEIYEKKIKEVAENINHYANSLSLLEKFPSIYFGLEMGLLDLKNGGKRLFFDTDFSKGKSTIPINGLIWMGTPEFMQKQIEQKLKDGFTCLKMKIGAIDFEEEYRLLKTIREKYSSSQITLRVDANGAFSPKEALEKLARLKELDIHSIEQPIRQGSWEEMQKLCAKNIIPIALDEELIGIYTLKEKEQLLKTIRPQYIILKPSLIGGFKGTKDWIELSESLDIPWWITSALESNIGLEAIAQFTSNYPLSIPHGLGTGMLYTNNIPSHLTVKGGQLLYSF